jgi:propanediol dehydratase small subunit
MTRNRKQGRSNYVIVNWEEAAELDPKLVGAVQVPGEFVLPVYSLVRRLSSSKARRRRDTGSLLKTVAKLR